MINDFILDVVHKTLDDNPRTTTDFIKFFEVKIFDGLTKHHY